MELEQETWCADEFDNAVCDRIRRTPDAPGNNVGNRKFMGTRHTAELLRSIFSLASTYPESCFPALSCKISGDQE